MGNPDKSTDRSVLITGGSGLVGKNLTSLLLSQGYRVSHLSRKSNHFGRVRVHRWDPYKRIVDPEVFNGIDYIVHLAGANIGERRWTGKRKKEIALSRTDAARFIFDVLTGYKIKLKAFISASGIGYYGSETTERILTENDPHADDFLGRMCREWEEAADLFGNSGIRTVKIRTAVVLGKESSALEKLMIPARFGFLARIGSGRQYMPWIHVSDLARIYLKAIEDENMQGPYNAAAPQHMDHNGFMKSLADTLRCKVILPPVPGFIIRTFLGEMSNVILNGSRISSDKITKAGFHFEFSKLDFALENILGSSHS